MNQENELLTKRIQDWIINYTKKVERIQAKIDALNAERFAYESVATDLRLELERREEGEEDD